MRYTFWNNKGGTGKTSLAFQTICRYAELNKDSRILAVDLCPQANLSELFLGGLTQGGTDNLLKQQALTPRCSIGGYFEKRLPSPYTIPNFNFNDFITSPARFNSGIPKNIDLICGDPMLELQATAMNTLANTQLPGIEAWISVLRWGYDLLDKSGEVYDLIFFDCNPSFSIYTQIGLAVTDRLILPVMADDSSRRAVRNVLSLVYGFHLPSKIYAQYAFNSKLEKAGYSLPKVHLIVKNRITQYMGSASAYAAVLKTIEFDIENLSKSHPASFTFKSIDKNVVEIPDFQTTGVVAFAKGLPISGLRSGYHTVAGRRVQVRNDYEKYLNDIDGIVNAL